MLCRRARVFGGYLLWQAAPWRASNDAQHATVHRALSVLGLGGIRHVPAAGGRRALCAEHGGRGAHGGNADRAGQGIQAVFGVAGQRGLAACLLRADGHVFLRRRGHCERQPAVDRRGAGGADAAVAHAHQNAAQRAGNPPAHDARRTGDGRIARAGEKRGHGRGQPIKQSVCRHAGQGARADGGGEGNAKADWRSGNGGAPRADRPAFPL